MDNTFAELGLNEHVLAGVAALGFTAPTPVQAQAIPVVLSGHDVIASAQTGTGKTAAFALPVLQLIEPLSHAVREEAVASKEAKDPDAETGRPSGPGVLADDAGGSAALSVEVGKDGSVARPKRRSRRRKTNGSKAARKDGCEANCNARPFGPFALVVTPTRELAAQIEAVVSVVCQHTGQKAVVVMGGTKLGRQIRELESGCDLLVATPGRLIDLMEHGHVSLKDVRVFVLDEADRMLDMGFWPSVRRIVSELPQERQTLLFSATIPPSIKGTVDAMLKDPVSIEIARVGETADTVEEHLCPVTQGQKAQLLENLLADGGAGKESPERVLVFCRTKHRVDDLERHLRGTGIAVDVMHADRPQKARERALEKFRRGKVQVLVATDVMSRGIDVSGIDAVVNFDVPMDPEDYVHRIGRTGRAGAVGHAYTFVAPDEISPLREIEYFTKKLIPTWDLEGFPYDEARIVPNPGRSATKTARTMFSGSRSRGRGMSAGRYGRHY